MKVKLLSFLMLIFLTFSAGLISVNAADELVDQGDQASTTETTGTTDEIEELITETGAEEEVQVEEKAPLQDVFFTNKGEGKYTFDFNIEDATEVYATEFEEADKEYTLNTLVIAGGDGEDVSDELKASFSLIIKRVETGENEIFGLDELETDGGITLNEGDNMVLLYDSDGLDNAVEADALNNMVSFNGEELPKPLLFGIATTDDDLNISFDSEKKDYQENELPVEETTVEEEAPVDTITTTGTGNVEETNSGALASEENKELLTKTDTGPKTTISLLLMFILLLIASLAYVSEKKES